MADRTGKCINFGLCSKADTREIISVAGGGDFSCPECGKPLTEAAGAAGSGGKKSGGGMKMVAAGALGVVLIAGAAYKFMDTGKDDKKVDNSQNIAVQNQNPQNPQQPNQQMPNQQMPDQTLPNQQMPNQQFPNQQMPPQQFPNQMPPQQMPPQQMPTQQMPNQQLPPQRMPPQQMPQQTMPRPRQQSYPPQQAPPPAVVENMPPPRPTPGGVMTARLLSAIDTRTARVGDRFTAKIEDGPYSGGMLTGTIRKLEKKKSSVGLELSFRTINMGGQSIPVNLDLVDITNSKGVKGVDEENNKIAGKSSNKKVGEATGIGAGAGALIGGLTHGVKGALIGGGIGAGAGFVAGKTLLSHAQDVELDPGARMTLREGGR